MMADPAGWQPAALAWTAAKAAGLLALIFALGGRVMPKMLDWVGRTHDDELSILVLLALAMGIGVLSVWAGLSLELGAFVAGLVLSGSERTLQTMGRMLPMRDLFVVTFFVSLGVLLDPRAVIAHGGLLAGLLSFVLMAKMAVMTVLALAFRHPWAVAWRVGVGLSQIGEFSIVISTIAQRLGLLEAELHHVIVAASLLSIIVNTFLFNLFAKAPAMISAIRAAHPLHSPPAGRSS
jgi:CPA2 family monovalent cation:H+ antiporter-2